KAAGEFLPLSKALTGPCIPPALRLSAAQLPLFELFQMNEIGSRLVSAELIEEAQHTAEQSSILATAQLLGDDDAGMVAASRRPLTMQGSKITNVKRDSRTVLGDKGAIAALEKAMELTNGGDGSERFFIAMASWRMGKPNQARACYEQAVQWMAKHKPRHHELRRFRTEAAKLLRIQDHSMLRSERLPPPKEMPETAK